MRLSRRRKFEEDMDREMRFHMEAYVEDLLRSGIDRAEAERRAHIEFGAVEARKDECRHAAGFQLLDDLRADLCLSLRTLTCSPGFAGVGILSLALGIGATTAILGVVDAVLLRLLPVRDPGGLVFVQTAGTAGRDGPPYPYFALLRDQAQGFEAMAMFSPSAMELGTDRGRELARGVWVSGNFYQTLGVRPLLGRALSAEDDRAPGAGGSQGAVAVISRTFWRQRFGGDPSVLGRTIQLFNSSVTIVGVMPDETMSLSPGSPVDIAVPVLLSDPNLLHDRTSLWLEVVGRLKPGVAPAQARTEAEVLFQAYMRQTPISNQIRQMLFQHIEVAPAGQGLSGLRRELSRPLLALLMLASLVLLAACINLTNLLLARATARQQEFAVRLAIGASRGRLIRQSLADAMLLVTAGAALAIVIARAGQMEFARFFADGKNSIIVNLSLNPRVFLFTVAVAVVSGIALAAAPALRAAGANPAEGLQGGTRNMAGTRKSVRWARALVVLQVALSTVLLAGAGIFVRTLHRLEAVDVGFQREGLLTMEVTPERTMFGAPDWLRLQDEILERTRRVPGVSTAGWATMTPFSGRDRSAVLSVPGFTPSVETDKYVHLAAVSADYFAALGVPLRLGRPFTELDDLDALNVAIVNQAAARFYFGSNPIGRKIQFTNYPGRKAMYEVVGVVKDIKHDSLRETAPRFVYVPIQQSLDRINRLALVVRTAGSPMSIAGTLRRQIQDARSTLLITNVSTIDQQVAQVLQRERLLAVISTTFGVIALVLAAIGLYGLLAYAVTRRTNEIGILIALGATHRAVVWMVLREAWLLAGAGLLLGVPAAVASARVAQALLFGVSAIDLPTFGCTISLLLIVVTIAATAPSRKAISLDPTSALRRE